MNKEPRESGVPQVELQRLSHMMHRLFFDSRFNQGDIGVPLADGEVQPVPLYELSEADILKDSELYRLGIDSVHVSFEEATEVNGTHIPAQTALSARSRDGGSGVVFYMFHLSEKENSLLLLDPDTGDRLYPATMRDGRALGSILQALYATVGEPDMTILDEPEA